MATQSDNKFLQIPLTEKEEYIIVPDNHNYPFHGFIKRKTTFELIPCSFRKDYASINQKINSQ